MNKNILFLLAFVFGFIFLSLQNTFAKNKHNGHKGHNKYKEYDEHEEHKQHDEHKEHKEHKEHDEHEENNKDEEARVTISEESAKKVGIRTRKAHSQMISETISLTGKILLDQNRVFDIKARFPGVVKDLRARWGQKVKKGQVLAVIESNDSLNLYSIKSPENGIVIHCNTNIGNISGDDPLFTIADLSKVWVEFHIFPKDIPHIKAGQKVVVSSLGDRRQGEGKISFILPIADAESQTVIAIISLVNTHFEWKPGMTVEGQVKILEKKVPVAIKKEALQRMENKTVIFVKRGRHQYESRHVQLGKGDDKYRQVIKGLSVGEEYVSQESFIIKADILKSTAEHSH